MQPQGHARSHSYGMRETYDSHVLPSVASLRDVANHLQTLRHAANCVPNVYPKNLGIIQLITQQNVWRENFAHFIKICIFVPWRRGFFVKTGKILRRKCARVISWIIPKNFDAPSLNILPNSTLLEKILPKSHTWDNYEKPVLPLIFMGNE